MEPQVDIRSGEFVGRPCRAGLLSLAARTGSALRVIPSLFTTFSLVVLLSALFLLAVPTLAEVRLGASSISSGALLSQSYGVSGSTMSMGISMGQSFATGRALDLGLGGSQVDSLALGFWNLAQAPAGGAVTAVERPRQMVSQARLPFRITVEGEAGSGALLRVHMAASPSLTLTLYRMDGRAVGPAMTQSSGAAEALFEYQLPSLSAGRYLCRLVVGNQSYTGMVVLP
jgi:hypothetical protein